MPPRAVHPIESVPRADLERLFDEEGRMWAQDLNWNFEPTRGHLRTALGEGTLRGFASRDDLGACAYATYAIDGDRGIVGSVFSSQRSRGLGLEDGLVREILDRLRAEGPRVIDCQTLFSSARELVEPFADLGFLSAERIYMTLDRGVWPGAGPALSAGIRSSPTHRLDLGSVAGLVYEAHREGRHFDASSSFDTPQSCERILRQIILDEVCGPFDSLGSRRVEAGGRLVAASLLTWPLPGVAHISELATAPSHQRRGLARHCLSETLCSAFKRSGASSATLSVTATNRAAIALYESMGFVGRLSYRSHVRREEA